MTDDTMRTAPMALGAALALGLASATAQETPLVRERLQLWADCSPSLTATGAPSPCKRRFELWTDCKPLSPMILVVDNREGVPKLTWESVQSAVESRLRSARLYSNLDNAMGDDPTSVLLQIYVNTIGDGYSDNRRVFFFNIGLSKRLLDLETGIRDLMQTYQTRFEGIGTREDIRFKLAEYIDEFLAEYLRVNEAACGKSNAE